MTTNKMKEYSQPKVTVVSFKVERAIADSGGCKISLTDVDDSTYLCYD